MSRMADKESEVRINFGVERRIRGIFVMRFVQVIVGPCRITHSVRDLPSF